MLPQSFIDRPWDQRRPRSTDGNETVVAFEAEMLSECARPPTRARRHDLRPNASTVPRHLRRLRTRDERQTDLVEREHFTLRDAKLTVGLQDADLTLHFDQLREAECSFADGNLETR